MSGDREEDDSNRFALEVLTGDPAPTMEANVERFSAKQLAFAALDAAHTEHVDPGVLALCLGHATGRWRQTMGALKLLPPGVVDVGSRVNRFAQGQFAKSQLSIDTLRYLNSVASAEDD